MTRAWFRNACDAAGRSHVTAIVGAAMLCLLVSTSASGNNTLHDNWSGQPLWESDTGFIPPGIPGGPHSQWHSESTTVFFAGRYRMYHRYFDPDPGAAADNVHIGVSTGSTDNSFADTRIVISRHNLLTPGCSLTAVSAPKANISQAGLLTLVFEASLGPPGPCNPYGVTTSIGMAHSWDGVNFFAARIIIAPEQAWEGRDPGFGGGAPGTPCHGWPAGFPGNVGTPTIDHTSQGYWVTYHGFNCNTLKLNRGVRFWPTLDPTQIESGVAAVRSPDPMRFLAQNGGGLPASVYGVGIGAADIEVWHDSAGGTSGVPASFYMVLEAFAGSPVCDQTAKTTVAIAKATSIAGPWYVQDRVLLGQKQSCGRDMPAWWYDLDEGRYKVVLTTDGGGGDAADLQRITLLNAYREPPPPSPTPTPAPTPCDDGNACTVGCTAEIEPRCMTTILSLLLDGVCGDGILEADEECDDGNEKNGDCCSATCGFEPDGTPCSKGCDGKMCDGGGLCVP